MDNLRQVIIQTVETAGQKQAVVQGGTAIIPENQEVVLYSDLSAAEQTQYDDFVTMINSKTV